MNENLIAIVITLLCFSPVFYELGKFVKENRHERKIAIKKLRRFLKYSFGIFFLTLTGIAVLSHTNFLDYEEPLTFDKYNQITFENFRGLEFFKKSLYGNERFAYVVTSIESNIEGNSVAVLALFYPSRSFVYSKNTNSKELLTHEKYHFKITELFTRKAKQQISKLDRLDKSKIERILQNIRSEERKFQIDYDYHTFHSYILSEQKKYEKQIDSLLHVLTIYKKPKIYFND